MPITLTIDGKAVQAQQGQTVLEAAKQNGVYIPTLCADPDLEPFGGCRLCVVEIEKMRGLPTACTTPVAEGMVVRTSSALIEKERRNTIELLLSDHPQDCLTCVKNQRCELQSVAAYVGVRKISYQGERRAYPIDESNPFYGRDLEKCILCGKCVRACDELQGRQAIHFGYRGFSSKITTLYDLPMWDSTCESCGRCVDMCPTAALYDKAWLQDGWHTGETATICPYCGVGCGLVLQTRAGKVVGVRGDRSNPASHGHTCVKGRFGTGFIHHKDRLTKPLVKKDGASHGDAPQFVETTWEEALDLIAKKLTGIKKQAGADALAVLASAKATNEENYLIQKFARAVIGTNNVDHCARLCHASTVSGLAAAFGSGAMTNSIDDLDEARTILVIGSNTTEQHPVIGTRVRRAVRKGAQLIVADPRRIDLSSIATIYLRHRPGTDTVLLNGLANIILANGWEDKDFIASRTENFEAWRAAVEKYTPARVSEITGVPVEELFSAAKLYATVKPAAILYAMGITQHTSGHQNVLAVANLAMLTGNLGKPGAGVNPLRGQNNVQGSCDMGALPNVYTAYQSVTNAAAREKFENAWGGKLPEKPGLTVVEILNAAHDRRVKGMWIIGENPAMSDPDSSHVREALEQLDFLVVQDIFLTETAQLADVVLPATSFAEKDGTFTNTERRVQRVRQAVEPPGEARADWWIVAELASRMAQLSGEKSQTPNLISQGKDWEYAHPEEIFKEMAALTPSYAGITYARLEQGGLQWPVPNAEHPGTPVLHREKFTRGLGFFTPVEFVPPAENPDAKYPLVLTTGRVLQQYHTGTMTHKIVGLDQLAPEERVEINPEDAIKLKIVDGDLIQVSSRRGRVKAHAHVTPRVDRGVVFMTFHYAEALGNVLTNAALDPIAKIPELKVCAVRVERA